SLALARVVPVGRHPLRIYALLEVGIGVLGILALFLAPLVARLYGAAAGTGLPGMLLRGVVGAVCSLPPTSAMGASLRAWPRRIAFPTRSQGKDRRRARQVPGWFM